jgi:hypothetical protein
MSKIWLYKNNPQTSTLLLTNKRKEGVLFFKLTNFINLPWEFFLNCHTRWSKEQVNRKIDEPDDDDSRYQETHDDYDDNQ